MNYKNRVVVGLVGLLALANAGCVTTQNGGGDSSLLPCGNDCGEEVAAFDRSLLQTAVFRQSGVLPLTPLKYPVQAVNYTTYPQWATGKEGQTVVVNYETWITVEPEVKEVCRTYAPQELIPKVNKLLGLQPATAKDDNRKFILFTMEKPATVGPTGQGVFRPCADPDVTATTCGNTIKGSDDYVKWFANNMVNSYKLDKEMGNNGYPWTRLGYTYNWDQTSPDHRGPQEYVVPVGVAVKISAILSPAEYCR